MTKCDFCGQDHNILFTCNECRDKYCSIHKHPIEHNCSSVKYDSSDNISLETEKNVYDTKSVIESSSGPSLSLMQEQLTHDIILEENIEVSNLPVDHIVVDNQIEKYVTAGVRAVQSAKQEINEETKSKQKSKKKRKNREEPGKTKQSFSLKDISKLINLRLFYVAVLLASLGMNGLLFYDNENYDTLVGTYFELYDNTIMLQSYYEALGQQYNDLTQEHNHLENQYSDLLTSNTLLETEFYEIINHQKEIQLESSKHITLGPNESFENVYEIPFSGYMEVTYNSSNEVFMRVGSTSLDDQFYSKLLQFPESASNNNFTIPVSPNVLIQYVNPDEYETVEVTYTIKFTY